MSTQHITRLLSAGAVVTALVVGVTLGRPLWMWFLLPALIAGALLIDIRVSRAEGTRPTAPGPDLDESVPEPPAEVPYQETSIVVVPVQSAVEDCPFLFSASVWWRPAGRFGPSAHGNPAALAATSVLQRVESMTLTESPGRCTFLERSLEGVLGTPVLDGSGLVEAFATDIRLVLRPRDREHLEELDGLRKAMGSWESRRQHERNLREYLGEDVLRSPGNAVVWWMARHEDEIERAVDMIAPLTVLSAAANDEEIPEEYRDLFRGRGRPVGGEPMSGFDHPEPGGGQSPSGHGPDPSCSGTGTSGRSPGRLAGQRGVHRGVGRDQGVPGPPRAYVGRGGPAGGGGEHPQAHEQDRPQGWTSLCRPLGDRYGGSAADRNRLLPAAVPARRRRGRPPHGTVERRKPADGIGRLGCRSERSHKAVRPRCMGAERPRTGVARG
ncbi:hypothetical protein EQG64_18185 [Streptomyces sp. S6]|nr:hypothetical protein EQG64_18185 [Streptomyces sp. S6]